MNDIQGVTKQDISNLDSAMNAKFNILSEKIDKQSIDLRREMREVMGGVYAGNTERAIT